MKVVRNLSRQSGAASLIVTIILMIAVISIVGTLSVIALRDVRQSGDLDQSSQALNAAQAGLEQLTNKVNLDPNFQQPTCNGNTSTSSSETNISDNSTASSQDVAITCATVVHAGTDPGGYLLRDQSVTYDLSKVYESVAGAIPPQPQSNYDSVVSMGLRWNDFNTDVTDPAKTYDYLADPPAGTIDFPELLLPKAAHPRGEPATMELMFSWCPRLSNNKNSEDYTKCNYTANYQGVSYLPEPTYTTVIRPSTLNQDPDISSDCKPGTDIGFITNINCQTPKSILATAAEPYCAIGQFCSPPLDLSKVIPGMGGDKNKLANYIIKVKIKARYSGTRYSVYFVNNDHPNGKRVYFNYPFAILDVTARSGDVYRRVNGTRYTSFNSYNFLDTALFSGYNICKNLTIYRAGGGPGATPQQNTCAEGSNP